jgi:Zn-dependent protease
MARGLAFRIAGIPVRIDPSFLLIVVLLGFGAGSGALLVAWIVVVTISVLLHELGHAVAFRRFGQEPSILLQGMGGLTAGSGAPLSPTRDVIVSLAGPLTGLLLLGLPALLYSHHVTGLSPTAKAVLNDVVFVNLAWSILNLLPILPLDGGRVSAAFWALRTHGQGQRQALLTSAAVAGAAGVLALVNGYTFGATFAALFCVYNVSQLTSDRNRGLQRRLVEGWQALGRGDAEAAGSAAEAVLADRPSALVMGQAMELAAWSRLARGDRAGARLAIERYPHGRTPDAFLLAALDLDEGRSQEALAHASAAYGGGGSSPAAGIVADAFVRAGLDRDLVDRLLAPDGPGASAVAQLAVDLHHAGRFDEAAAAGRRALDAGAADAGRVAYNLACAHARAGQVGVALDWLDRAAELGFADAGLLDSDPDLDALRDDARFRSLRDRLRGAAGP